MTNIGGTGFTGVLAAAIFLAAGCSATVENEPGKGSPGGETGCADDLPSAAVLMSTPRNDTNIELLALKFSDQEVADQSVYDRLVRDIAAIREQNASVATITYFSPNDGKSLLLTVDSGTASAIDNGSYHEWDCLNDAYGATSFNVLRSGETAFAEVILKGIYRLDTVAKNYARLKGIKSAVPASGGGDGPTICLTRANDVWHYIFDDASGDCFVGCTKHIYTRFTTTESGVVTNLGEPSPDEVLKYVTKEACG